MSIRNSSIVLTGPAIVEMDNLAAQVMLYHEISFDGITIDSFLLGDPDYEFLPHASSSLELENNVILQSTSAAIGEVDVVYGSLIWFDSQNEILDSVNFLSPYNPDSEPGLIGLLTPEEITLDSFGNIYLSCGIFSQATTGNDFVIFKISPTGEMLWQYIYATESSVDWCHAIAHDGEGLIVAGFSIFPDNDNQITKFVFRLLDDNEGIVFVDETMNFEIDMPDFSWPRGMLLEADGIVFPAASILQGEGVSPLLYKIDFGGNILWQSPQVIDWYQDNQEYSRVIATEDGGYLCVGSEHLQGDNIEGWESDVDWNGILVKHNNIGEVLWIRRYKYIESCKEEHFIYDLKATPDGGYVFCGQSRDGCSDANWIAETPRQQGWVVKVDACGCLVPGCDENCVVGVDEFVLENKAFKVGPNPTTQFLNIYLAQDEIPSANNQFQLFDAKGKIIKQFVAQKGGTTYMLDVDKYASGTYILSLLKEGIVVQIEKVVIE